jgi:flagellar hook-basal body complex protein FliE
MIQFNPNAGAMRPDLQPVGPQTDNPSVPKADFSEAVKAIGKCVSKVDDIQHASDASVQDLLTGKNNDITTVVSAVAKADMSFKVLVGVRNKLIEAYKQTMNMPL